MGKGLRLINLTKFGDSTKFIEVINNEIFSVDDEGNKVVIHWTIEELLRMVHNRQLVIIGTAE